MKNAAVFEIVQLVERIDAADQWHTLEAAIGRNDLGDQPLPRLELAMQTANRDLLVAPEAKRLPRTALFEAQRQNAHSNEIGAVNAFERLADHRADAE